MAAIKYPGKHDVMLGRGGESNYHSGNIAFRHSVQKYKEAFRLGSRKEKNRVIETVVQAWRTQEPPGRFVSKHRTDTGECFWNDVGDGLAKKRAAKSLAEWTPQNKFPQATLQVNQIASPQAIPQAAESSQIPRRAAVAKRKAKIPDNEQRSFKRHVVDMPDISIPSTMIPPGVCEMQQHQQQPPLAAGNLLSEIMGQDSVNGQRSAKRQFISTPNVSTPLSTMLHTGAVSEMQQHQQQLLTEDNQVSEALGRIDCKYTVAIQNQFSNLTDMQVFPIEKIRSQLPTAAELSCVFQSSDDERVSLDDSAHSSSRNSCGSLQGMSGSYQGMVGSSANSATNSFSTHPFFRNI